MPDREKVINELVEHIESALAVDSDYVDCVRTDLLQTVVGLLKEQEAVMPNVSSVNQRCGNCNKVIEMDGWKTCPWCGKPIDWARWWRKNTNGVRRDGRTD